MQRIIKNFGLPFAMLLGLGVSMYFYSNPKLGGADPSSLREVTAFKEYLDKDGNGEVLYAYKGATVTNNLIDDHTELVSSERKKDKNGKDIIENTYKIYDKGQFLKEGNSWTELLYATTTQSKFSRPIASYFINIALATDFVGASDGWARRATGSESFATIRAGDGTSSDGANNWELESLNSGAGAWQRIGRGKGLFDASSIDDTFVVTSASLTLNNQGKAASDPHSSCYYVTSHDTDANANAEYQHAVSAGATKYSNTSVCYADITAGADNVWTFNASGIAGISLTAVTGIGLRLSWDFDNSEPGGTGNGDAYWYSSTGGTADQDPFLTVVASAPAVATYRQPDVFIIRGDE